MPDVDESPTGAPGQPPPPPLDYVRAKPQKPLTADQVYRLTAGSFTAGIILSYFLITPLAVFMPLGIPMFPPEIILASIFELPILSGTQQLLRNDTPALPPGGLWYAVIGGFCNHMTIYAALLIAHHRAPMIMQGPTTIRIVVAMALIVCMPTILTAVMLLPAKRKNFSDSQTN